MKHTKVWIARDAEEDFSFTYLYFDEPWFSSNCWHGNGYANETEKTFGLRKGQCKEFELREVKVKK